MIKRRDIFFTAVIIILSLAVVFCRRPVRVVDTKRVVDTVIIRDTLRDTVLVPRDRYIVRTDTVRLFIPGDTVRVEVEVPIERKVYRSDDYRAVVEGFRPDLVEIEIYRQTYSVTNTDVREVVRRARWGIGVQAGYGYNFDRFYPYVGVGIQYNLISW